MLPAQKEHIRQILSAAAEELPNVGSFGKVVNSIQGLQQRLDGFSAEDVGVAHNRTQTLVLRLADLQHKLTEFAAIRESMAAARVTVEQMLADCADPLKCELVEEPLTFQTLIQTNKLIYFPRLSKLFTDANISLTHANTTLAAASTANDEVDQKREASDHVEQVSEDELRQKTAHWVSDAPPALGEVLTASSPEHGKSADASPLEAAAEAFSATSDSSVAAELTTPEADVDKGHGYDSSLSITPTDEVNISVTEHEPAQASPVNARTDFDQRLLDDLIKNYGEFATALSSPCTPDTQDVASANSAPAAPEDTVQPADVPVERDNLPEIKKHGDIDRQLKKIIKDYGEYDLYSRQGAVNLKTGVIAAFLLLALLLSGFYYFSPANSQHSTAPAPGAMHSSGATEATDGQNVARQHGMGAGDAAALRGTDTNSRPKNRK